MGCRPCRSSVARTDIFEINDGVTRATRAAKLRPGELVPAEVIQILPRLDVTLMPRVKDRLP